MAIHVEENNVEVDMVPLIDIISLVLMFLIIVGDTAAAAGNVAMQLPRADEGKSDDDLKKMNISTAGRIVVQLQPENTDKMDTSKYWAVVQNKRYELVGGGGNKAFLDFLEKHINQSLARGDATKDDKGAVNIPVKLRVPEKAPMRQVELVVMTLARMGLVNVQYAATPK